MIIFFFLNLRARTQTTFRWMKTGCTLTVSMRTYQYLRYNWIAKQKIRRSWPLPKQWMRAAYGHTIRTDRMPVACVCTALAAFSLAAWIWVHVLAYSAFDRSLSFPLIFQFNFYCFVWYKNALSYSLSAV